MLNVLKIYSIGNAYPPIQEDPSDERYTEQWVPVLTTPANETLTHTVNEVGMPGSYRPPPLSEIIEENSIRDILGSLSGNSALYLHPTRWSSIM